MGSHEGLQPPQRPTRIEGKVPGREKFERPEILKNLEDNVLAQFSEPQFVAWMNFQSRFHTYTMRNVLLIMLQDPDATRVAGKVGWNNNGWESKGRTVIEGAPSITIIRPVERTFEVEDENGEKKKIKKLVGFRGAEVYDIRHTEGDPLPKEPEGPELVGNEGQELLVPCWELATAEGLRVENVDAGALNGEYGYYNRREKRIVIRNGPAKEMATTFVHELAHFYRGDEQGWTMSERPHEETIAESTAYVVMKHFGVDTGEFSFPYVAQWCKEPKRLMKAMGHIQHTSDKIINRLEQLQAPVPVAVFPESPPLST